MNILVFPASVKKIWIDDIKRVRNPGYWLFGLFVKQFAVSHHVYVAGDSVEMINGLYKWTGQPIDLIVILGADYTPSDLKITYKDGYPTNGPFAKTRFTSEQIYRIRDDLTKLSHKPPTYFLSVDVRGWEPNAERVLGISPDEIITEQEMQWQEIGYVMARKIREKLPKRERRGFGFHGHIKNRGDKALAYFKNLPVPATLDGIGWDKKLEGVKTKKRITCRGQQTFLESAQMMTGAKYSVTMHEPTGNEEGWITTRYFENIGFNVLGFVDHEYDRNCRIIEPNDFRRVFSANELHEKILFYERFPDQYTAAIKKQHKGVDPLCMNFNQYFFYPLKHRLGLS